MRTDAFDYQLPTNLIAQAPLTDRDESRLMVVRRETGAIEHRVFRDLPELLAPGDLLVLNDTKVVPARLLGRRSQTWGRWEGLFLRSLEDGTWELMCQTRGRLTNGEVISIDPPPLRLRLVRKTVKGTWVAEPSEAFGNSPFDLLEKFGQVPLPPYIQKGAALPDDKPRYQTVYARKPGAVAAPTAGLHFTPRLFGRLMRRRIERTFVTLHVGAGTFQPIKVDDIERHPMHQEWGQLASDAVKSIEDCEARGGRVVAVGTTTVRVLEAAARGGPFAPSMGEIDLYIYPPYKFRIVDALVTNFHLPRSSLLVLVSAIAGVDLIRRSYREAVEREYRFYSYGDAMLIL